MFKKHHIQVKLVHDKDAAEEVSAPAKTMTPEQIEQIRQLGKELVKAAIVYTAAAVATRVAAEILLKAAETATKK